MLGANRERGLALIYAGRVLAGIGVGAASMITPIYISEISPPAVRGRIVGIYELGWQIGGLVGFWINYGLSETMAPSRKQWIIPFAVQLIPAGLLLIGAFWLRESPRWLFSKNRREAALKNLCWIRNLQADDVYLVEEVAMMDAAMEEQAASIGLGFWKPFLAVKRNRKVQWRFLLGGLLFMWQNGSGINAINYYSPTVFKSIGVVGTNAGEYTVPLSRSRDKLGLLILFFLPIDRLLNHRNLRRSQNRPHRRLDVLPHRQSRPPQSSHHRRRRRFSLHVDYRWLHQHQRHFCRRASCSSKSRTELWWNCSNFLFLLVDGFLHSFVEWNSLGH